ncbi:MAG: hypothetical protein M3124_01375 [Actinomycetota bacterium]|nr:hypothetical protein [Actinomycetota bacterium]
MAPRWQVLTALLTLLLLLVVAHDIDHVVNEERLGELSVAFWIFLPFQYGAFLVVVVLAGRRHSKAPILVGALAATSLVAFAGAHLVPFGLLPYADGDPLAISWALVYVPMAVAALTLALALRVRASGRVPGRVG